MQDVPKIAVRRLQGTEVAEAHPDADLLTAFAERSLAEGEQARVMVHLAACRDCRDIVALALPATEEVTAVAAVSGRTGHGWFSWPVLRWGLVAAGVLVVMSVGVVQYKQAQVKSKSGEALTARNTAPVEGQAASPPAAEARVAVPQTVVPKPSERLKKQQSNSALRGSLATAGTKKNATPMAATMASGRDVGVPRSSQMVELQSEAAPAVTARNGVTDQLIASNAPAAQPQSVTQGDVVKAKPAAPLTPSVVLDPANSPSQKETSAMQASPRWTISSTGTLQRSFDDGNTWENVSVNVTAGPLKRATAAAEPYGKREKNDWMPPSSGLVFRAVAALGTEVWAGGSGGALYHSGDSGAHWTRVVPSSGEGVLSGDISRIQFSDPQHGTVATSTGDIWLTLDGGLTWRRQP